MTIPKTFKRSKNFLFLGIIPSVLFLFVCLWTIAWSHTVHLDNLVQSELNTSFRMLYGELYQEARLLGVLAEEMGQEEKVRAAFLAGDRERLQKVTAEAFSNDRSRYNVTHLYFIGLDRGAFLRMHKPEVFGDIIDRHTLKTAERTGKLSYGLEMGMLGTLTLRVVTPWMVDGRKIGYIEIGVESEEIIEELKKIIGVDAVLLVDKSRLVREDWQKGMQMLGRDAEWERFPESVQIYSTMPKLPRMVDMSIQRQQQFISKTNLVMEIDGRSYMGGFTPLLDAADQDIGDVVFLKDITLLKSIETRMTILLLGGYVFCVLFFMIFVFWYVHRLKVNFTDMLESESADR